MSKPVIVRFIGDPKNLNATVDKVEGRFSGLKGKLLGFGIGALVVKEFKDAGQAGINLNETTNKLGLAFGKNAGDIQAWAKGSAKNMGLPKQAAEENAASFGLLFSKLGLTGAETTKMSKGMVQLAVDLGSVHNADPTEILQAQQAAFRGEYDSLQKFVPALTAATVQTEALKETGKHNAKSLTDQEKATATYNIMLQQTKKEQGDFAKTSDQAANKTKINAARIADLQANIGTMLLPAITAATNALGGFGNWMERNKGAASALGIAIIGVTGFVLAMSVATKVSTAVQAAARGATIAWTVAQKALNLAMRMNMIGLIITGLILLIGWIVISYKRSETFRNIVQGAFRAVMNAGRAMWDGLRAAFNFIKSAMGNLASFVASAARNGFLGPIPLIIARWGQITSFFRALPGRVMSFLTGLPGQMLNLGARLVSSFVSGIRSMAGAIVSAISDIIPGPIKRFLHLGSPAKEGPMSEDGGPERWGEKVSQFFVKGMAKGARGLSGGFPPGFPPGSGAGAMLALPGGSRGLNLTINAHTNASAAEIGHELAWQLRTSGR